MAFKRENKSNVVQSVVFVTSVSSSPDAPGAPGKPQIQGTMPTHIAITWAAPESDGGAPITGYVVEKRDTARERWLKGNKEAVTENTYTVPDLLEGNEYEFRVCAENKAGAGPPSEPSDRAVAKLPFGESVFQNIFGK